MSPDRWEPPLLRPPTAQEPAAARGLRAVPSHKVLLASRALPRTWRPEASICRGCVCSVTRQICSLVPGRAGSVCLEVAVVCSHPAPLQPPDRRAGPREAPRRHALRCGQGTAAPTQRGSSWAWTGGCPPRAARRAAGLRGTRPPPPRARRATASPLSGGHPGPSAPFRGEGPTLPPANEPCRPRAARELGLCLTRSSPCWVRVGPVPE